mgnify:CR=1 FL=1
MLLMLALGCLQELSGSCETHRDCRDDEVCTKGACLGRPCDHTDDCEPGWECADAMGSTTCLLPCEDEDVCLGSTSCVDLPVTSDPQSDVGAYCL